MSEYIYGFEPCEKIPEMKMVQREEIVRCRDCRLWKDDCEWNRFYNDPDLDEPYGFCAWACPKEYHKDENKENNHVSNLEWCTAAYNNVYGTRIERVKKTKAKSNDERRGDV